jgi:hypothetical protein
MAASPRSAADAPADVAAQLQAATFVRLLPRRDGDAVAAAGLLADALDVPYQIRPVATEAERGDAAAAGDPEDTVVCLGGTPTVDADAALAATDGPVSPAAYAVATTVGRSPDPVLALAGCVAGGRPPDAADLALEAAQDAGLVDRRAGVAVPTDDVADGLANTTLVYSTLSGDVGAARERLADCDRAERVDERQAVASLLALASVESEAATPRAATTVERALRPYATPDARFATVGGYADVLDAAARSRPGLAVGLAVGGDVRETALEAWRAHGQTVHAALDAEADHHDDLAVVYANVAPAHAESVARCYRDFRADRATVLVIGDAVAGVATDEGAPAIVEAARSAMAGAGSATADTGLVTFEPSDSAAATLIGAVTGAA